MLKIEFDQALAPKKERLQKTLLHSIERALDEEVEGLPDGIIAVAFISDEKMSELNAQYRNKENTTDVLSFSYVDDAEEGETVGDVVISYEQVAKQQKKGIRHEVVMLLVHGILHVLGHDHMKKNEAKIMFALQDNIVSKVV